MGIPLTWMVRASGSSGKVPPQVSAHPTITASEFAAKWKASTRTESAAAQEHFNDLCELLGVQTPNEADPTGEWYAFEKGAEKVSGGDALARQDLWARRRISLGLSLNRRREQLACALARVRRESRHLVRLARVKAPKVRVQWREHPERVDEIPPGGALLAKWVPVRHDFVPVRNQGLEHLAHHFLDLLNVARVRNPHLARDRLRE